MPRSLKHNHRIPVNHPLAYFITIRTYGTWLHGDIRGSVTRQQNTFGTPKLEPNPELEKSEYNRLHHDPIIFDGTAADLVEKTVTEVCAKRECRLHAVKMRSNHLHVVVSAIHSPERVLADLKAWATRRLRENGFIGAEIQPWGRHGSTIYLWTAAQVEEKVEYVITGQGPPLMGQDTGE